MRARVRDFLVLVHVCAAMRQSPGEISPSLNGPHRWYQMALLNYAHSEDCQREGCEGGKLSATYRRCSAARTLTVERRCCSLLRQPRRKNNKQHRPAPEGRSDDNKNNVTFLIRISISAYLFAKASFFSDFNLCSPQEVTHLKSANRQIDCNCVSY